MTGPEETEELAGGVNVVLRTGDTVRRPWGAWTPAVHALLDHLAARGFTGAPRAHGRDEAGREVLDFIPGEVNEEPGDDDAVRTVGALLRAYHDATADFVAPAGAAWQLPARAPGEVICHGDVAPYNCVVRAGRPVAFIDFDTAHPGPRRWDVAYAAYRFAPLSQWGPPVVAQARRLRLLADAYGLGRADRDALVDTVLARLAALADHIVTRAAAGDPAYGRHLAEGHVDRYRADAAHVAAHRAAFTAVLAGGGG